jgi:hypothetical protein
VVPVGIVMMYVGFPRVTETERARALEPIASSTIAPPMRARPTWDVIVLALMLGGLALTVTGFYLALRRVWSDTIRVVRVATRRAPAPHSTALQSESSDG